MTESVAIIDGGGANIASLRFALDRLGVTSSLTQDHATIRAAGRVILPGVGAAASAMQRLQSAGLDTLIPELTQPVLGICLGMQLLFRDSEEDATRCLNIIDGSARRFAAAADRPVPHMGWNHVAHDGSAKLLRDIPDGTQFYFVHSYAVDIVSETVGTTEYGHAFTSVVQRDNFAGTQFHPERSGALGSKLLANFLRIKS